MHVVHKIRGLSVIYEVYTRRIINVEGKYHLYFLWSVQEEKEDIVIEDIAEKKIYKSKFVNGYLYINNVRLKPISYNTLNNAGIKQKQGIIFAYFGTTILAEMNKIEAVSILKPYINSIAIQNTNSCAVSFVTSERHFILRDIPLCSSVLSVIKENNYVSAR